MNVEQGCFMPSVFSSNGGMGRECKQFYSVLANDNTETKARILHHNVLVATKKSPFR